MRRMKIRSYAYTKGPDEINSRMVQDGGILIVPRIRIN